MDAALTVDYQTYSCQYVAVCDPLSADRAATGEAMAEIILDGKATTTDISQLDPARFARRRMRTRA